MIFESQYKTDENLRFPGDGLAQSDEEGIKPWVVVVPFCLPGERVKCRVFKNDRMHSQADFIQVIRPNPELRDDERVKCKYFAKCGGCQYQVRATSKFFSWMVFDELFQMLSYETQLDFKRNVVVKAYKNYSGAFD